MKKKPLHERPQTPANAARKNKKRISLCVFRASALRMHREESLYLPSRVSCLLVVCVEATFKRAL
ncbi:hypothetical protein, partial [Variovorax sp. E3]|uniref:hypothetical protein n=1 Tax=Variovorax sp. E3 TaxID=1914993 RepID=UPI0022B63A05